MQIDPVFGRIVVQFDAAIDLSRSKIVVSGKIVRAAVRQFRRGRRIVDNQRFGRIIGIPNKRSYIERERCNRAMNWIGIVKYIANI
jgi:hypothetical protein